MRPVPRALALASCLAVAACSGAQFQAFSLKLQAFNQKVAQYAPLVGKDLLMVGDILVQAECSPALTPASNTAVNVLNIVARDQPSANTVASILATNQAVAAQLCPLLAAIKTQVGQVPKGAPSQVVTPPPAPAGPQLPAIAVGVATVTPAN